MKPCLGRLVPVLLLLLVTHAPAAEPTTETFASNFDGWTGNLDLYGGELFFDYFDGRWSWVAGTALFSAELAESAPVLPRPTAALIASNGAASGKFVGNWITGGIDRISFTFNASAFFNGTHTNKFNSTIVFFIWSGTNYAAHSFATNAVNTNVTFSASVESLTSGGWSGSVTNETDFDALKTNVSAVSIRTTIPSFPTLNPTYFSNRFDNVALESVQRAVQIMPTETGGVDIVWGHLMTNRVYTLQLVQDPVAGTWTNRTTLSPTSTTATISLSADEINFHRLIR